MNDSKGEEKASNKESDFKRKLEKYKANLIVKENIDKAWKGVLKESKQRDKMLLNPFLNANITLNPERNEHKKNIAEYYQKVVRSNYRASSQYNKFSIHTKQDFFNQKLFKNFKNTQRNSVKLLNINEIVQPDEKSYVYRVRKIALGKFLYSTPFQLFLAIIVCLYSIILALQTDNQLRKDYERIFAYFDAFTTAVFIIELVLKWIYSFKSYWYSLWNIFDFFLVVINLISLFFNVEQSKSVSASRLLRLFRVFRALRTLRSITILSRLQIIVNTILKSIYGMVNIVALMLLTMLMFSLFGNNLFGEYALDYFGDLDTGMLSLFYCATREGLTEIFEERHKFTDEFMKVIWVFFIIVAIIFLAFILANLIVAVVVTNMENALKENESKEQEELQKKLVEGQSSLPTAMENNIDKFLQEPIDVVTTNALENFPWSIQKSIENSFLQGLDISKAEKYFLVLDALEQNMGEYNEIRKDLDKVVNVVKDLSQKHDSSKDHIDQLIVDQRIKNEQMKKARNDLNLLDLKTANSLSPFVDMQLLHVEGMRGSRMTRLGSSISSRKSSTRSQFLDIR